MAAEGTHTSGMTSFFGGADLMLRVMRFVNTLLCVTRGLILVRNLIIVHSLCPVPFMGIIFYNK